MKKIIILTLAALFAYGCATANYAQKAMSISMDMTKEQVLDLMGPPKRVAARKSVNNQLVERYSWWSPKMIGFTPIDNELIATDRVFVSFKDGKVVEWGDRYDVSDSIERSREVQTEILKNIQNKSAK